MIIVRFHNTFQVRVIEWMLAGMTVSIGLVFASEPNIFKIPTYLPLSRIASAETWAWLCLTVGITRLVALTINGAVRSTPHVRAMMSFMTAFLWLQFVLGASSAPIRGFSIALIPWLVIAEVYSVFRATSDARISDDKARATKRAREEERASDSADNGTPSAPRLVASSR